MIDETLPTPPSPPAELPEAPSTVLEAEGGVSSEPLDAPNEPLDEPEPTVDAPSEPLDEPEPTVDGAAAESEPGPAAGEVAIEATTPFAADEAPISEPAVVAEAVAPAEPAVVAEAVAPAEPAVEPPTEPSPRVVSVGRAIAEALHAGGVRWAFTVPGESFLGLLEALETAGIRVVGTRHEAGAAFMAEAVGQLTGRPALCLATRAVGASNLAIGIHTARADSSPMIVAVGQVPRAFRGREAFQEADLASTIGGLARWAGEPTDVAAVAPMVGQALRAATAGRPGPVLLSLPEDLLDESIEAFTPANGSGPAPRPDPSAVTAVLRMLTEAERPVILAGGGVLRARCSNDLVRLAELLRVPVVAAWRRGDVVSNDHPLYLGMTGYGAPSTVRERLLAADALLVLGSRLNEVSTFGYAIPAERQRWAHVDLEPRGRGHDLAAPEIAIAADARAFIRAAIERLRPVVLEAAAVDARVERNAADRAAWEAASDVGETPWSGPGVHPGRIVRTLRAVLPDNAIVTTDAGNFAGWLARGFRFRRPGTFLGPTSGAMGYGLPAGIAAALVHRDRPVVVWAGDGGFAMTMAELETAVRERLRVVVLVLDNERYGTIRMHQDRRPDAAATATDLGPIDFVAVARGLGAAGVRVDDDGAFEEPLREALAADGPTVLHLPLDRRWVSVDLPPS